MHAGAGIFFDRLGHEAGGDAVPARLRADQPLQHQEIVGRLHHVFAVVQRQLVLAGRIFRDDCLGRNALKASRGIDVGEKRLHPVQMVDGIDLGLAARAAVEHRSGGMHAAIGVALIGEQEEFQLEGASRDAGPFRASASIWRASAWRGSEVVGCAVQRVHRHQHLAARRGVPCSGTSVPGIGHARRSPSPESQSARFVNVLAGDVEAEHRDRQVPPAFVEAL